MLQKNNYASLEWYTQDNASKPHPIRLSRYAQDSSRGTLKSEGLVETITKKFASVIQNA